MAALVTIADIEAALGTEISSDDEPRVQWYIDTVSAYVNAYVDEILLPVEDAVIICETDRYGAIEFGSLNSVSLVELYDNWAGTYTEMTTGNFAFDGISTIYGLTPLTTYRVTVSYGYTEVPTDVKGIVTDLVLAGTGLGAGSTIGGLKSYRVGDVEEAYGVDKDGGVTLSSLQLSALNRYKKMFGVWKAGW